MKIKRFAMATLAAALTIATTPTVILPAAAEGAKDCGYAFENGKLVFLGTCPHENGEATVTDAPSNPCPGRVDDGEFQMAC